MPYKDPQKRREKQREYSKRQEKRKRELKKHVRQQLQNNPEQLRRLAFEFPSVFELVFGKRRLQKLNAQKGER